MKVILSRKGFDSSSGGKASPILPDGTLLSLPIPENNSCRSYSELHYKDASYGKNESYEEIIKQLYLNFNNATCHLDPDIRKGIFTPDGWKPAFGQHDSSQTILHKAKVGCGDLFLFFGWFRKTKRDGRLRYVPNKDTAPDLHIIFGYLQIGRIITDQAEIEKKFPWHPHANKADTYINNCLYIPRDTLSWDESKPGFGVFCNDSGFILTKDNCPRSYWKPLSIFKKMAGHWNENHPMYGKYFEIAGGRGQEFVFEECSVVEDWAKSLF